MRRREPGNDRPRRRGYCRRARACLHGAGCARCTARLAAHARPVLQRTWRIGARRSAGGHAVRAVPEPRACARVREGAAAVQRLPAEHDGHEGVGAADWHRRDSGRDQVRRAPREVRRRQIAVQLGSTAGTGSCASIGTACPSTSSGEVTAARRPSRPATARSGRPTRGRTPHNGRTPQCRQARPNSDAREA
jgi:hypothetical protein